MWGGRRRKAVSLEKCRNYGNITKSQIESEKIRNQKQYNRMKSLNMQSETIQKWKENTGNQRLYSETREFGGQSDQSRFEKSDQSASIDSPQKCHHIWLRIFFIIFVSLYALFSIPPSRPKSLFWTSVREMRFFFARKQVLTCLIDGGSTTVSDVGTYRLLPFLKSRGRFFSGLSLSFAYGCGSYQRGGGTSEGSVPWDPHPPSLSVSTSGG